MTKILNKIEYLFRHPITSYYISHPLQLLKNRIITLYLVLKKTFNRDINFNDDIHSDIKIDIVVVATQKDFEVLGYVIDSIRQFVKHPLGQIIIISPKSKKIENLCKMKDCRFIDENKVLPITKKDINYSVSGIDRSGWLFQQLLKWASAKYVRSDYFLVTDADTIFCRPQVFMYNNKVILTVNGQFCYIPMFVSYNKLLGKNIKPVISFTSHHILIEKIKLKMLQNTIEKKNRNKWYRAIINIIDRNEISSVSDYDTYGQFVYSKYPRRFVLEHWFNLSQDRSLLNKVPKILMNNYNYRKYKTISFHSYKNRTGTKQ